MAKQNRSTIKTYFETGDVPTQTQFGDSFDSQVFWNDDVVTTLGTTDDKVPTEKAVSDAIAGIATPTLQDVTDVGNSTTNSIISNSIIQSNTSLRVRSNGGSYNADIKSDNVTIDEVFQLPDKGGAGGTFAMLSDITAGAVDSVNGQTGVVVLTLQDVTTAGASTTDSITTSDHYVQNGTTRVAVVASGQIAYTPNTAVPTNTTTIAITSPTATRNIQFKDESGTVALLSDITGGGVSSVTGTCVDNTDPANPVVNALALDGSNANSDVDLGTYALNAKSVKVNGTGGAGHVSMKHQSSGATAAASESVIYADNSGNPQWKNDGSAVERLLLQSDITQTITDGVTTKAPSEDAVFDALALKANLSQAAYSMLANNTGSTANMSAVTFKSVAKQTYSPTVNPSWTGTTPPSGATQHSYSWIQVGNVVSFYVCLVYATAGAVLSQVVFSLPSDMPTPLKPDGITAVTDVITMCNGQLAASNGLSSNIARAALRIDSASTSAFQFVIASSNANYRQAWISGVYFTS